MQPVAMGIGLTHSDDRNGKVIQAVTTPLIMVWSKARRAETATHAFVWFRDADGRVEYFEALEGAGWQGPFPISQVHEWAARDPRRWVKEVDLTMFLALSREELRVRYEFCFDMLEYWSYNTPQLILQLRTAGLGRRIIPASPRDVICSEAAARICHSDILNFREWCNKGEFDDISPERLRLAIEKMTKKRVLP